MAERRTRRRFTAKFKAEAVRRLPDGGKGLGEVATELGLSPGQLSAWRNEHSAAGSAEALARQKAEQAELQRLIPAVGSPDGCPARGPADSADPSGVIEAGMRRENRRLEEEVEILKKAA